VLFARRYLSWNAAEPQASMRSLEPFLGSAMESGAGLVIPASGAQRVEWAEVVQAREPSRREHVYTVAAQTDDSGLIYLTVSVERSSGRPRHARGEHRAEPARRAGRIGAAGAERVRVRALR